MSDFESIRGLICGKCGLVCVRHRGKVRPEVESKFRALQDENRGLKTSLSQSESKRSELEIRVADLERQLGEAKKKFDEYPIVRIERESLAEHAMRGRGQGNR